MGFNPISFISTFFDLIFYTIFIRILLSWFPGARGTSIYAFLQEVTEFIMYPVRLLLNKIGLNRGMIDWAPLLTLILLRAIEQFIIGALI